MFERKCRFLWHTLLFSLYEAPELLGVWLYCGELGYLQWLLLSQLDWLQMSLMLL